MNYFKQYYLNLKTLNNGTKILSFDNDTFHIS